ncbi:MAG: PQQ-dependent sugar dehydrogenase, partial [Acidimicrobiia bacterium]
MYKRVGSLLAALVAVALSISSTPLAATTLQLSGPTDQADPLRLGNEGLEETAAVAAESTTLAAADLPTGFVEQTVFSGLDLPTFIRFAADGRIFISEKRGTLLAFDSLTDSTPKTVVDFSAAAYGWWDRGMLGMTLDPAFPGSPFIYLLYTTDTEGYGDSCPDPPGGTTDGCLANARLSRVEVSSTNNLVGSEQVLLNGFWCQQYPSHSIGQLEFGSDGALYVSAGDGASFGFADWGQGGGTNGNPPPTPENPCGDPPVPIGGDQNPPTAEGGALRSQDLRTSGDPVSFDGAILRVNKTDGTAFSGNPLLGGDPADDRVIAYGLRNPFRTTIRPGTNELWLGDVGWGVWEEINRIQNPTAGVPNFGWPCYEGDAPHGSYNSANLDICENLYNESGAQTGPYFTYGHHQDLAGCPSGGSAISGLAFYEGGPYPSQYDNALFFADFTRGCIWTMFPGSDGLPSPSNISLFASSAPSVGLEIGPNGDLFAIDHLGGNILRYVFQTANNPPTAVAAASPTSGTAPLTVDFDGSASSDPDSDPLTYAWDLDGDGQFDDSTAVSPSFTYSTAGTRVVGLQVDDGQGGTDIDTVTITVSDGSTGDGHVVLPGLADNYITTPDHSRLDIVGDLDIRADVSLDDWQTAWGKFVTKLGGAYEFLLNQTTGQLRVAWRNSANTLFYRNSTTALPIADGVRTQLRATVDVDNVAGGHTVTFYYRTDTTLDLADPSGWTQLGSAITTTGTTNIRADNSRVVLGSNLAGSAGFWSGSYYQALILNGIGGTVAADPDFRTTTQLLTTPPDYSQWQDT